MECIWVKWVWWWYWAKNGCCCFSVHLLAPWCLLWSPLKTWFVRGWDLDRRRWDSMRFLLVSGVHAIFGAYLNQWWDLVVWNCGSAPEWFPDDPAPNNGESRIQSTNLPTPVNHHGNHRVKTSGTWGHRTPPWGNPGGTVRHDSAGAGERHHRIQAQTRHRCLADMRKMLWFNNRKCHFVGP